MTGWDEGPLDEARLQAAQMEYLRHQRVNGVVAAGLRASVADLRALAKRATFHHGDEQDVERIAATIEAAADELAGPDWLKSPVVMAEARAREEA